MRSFLARTIVLLGLLSTHVLASAAEVTDWPDADGTRFKGEPVSILGPLALFRTKAATLKRIPLRTLSADDCRRLYQVLASRPDRAARWADARSTATRELVGTTLQLDFAQRKLVPSDLTRLPEPELLVVIYGHSNLPGAWLGVNNLGPNYRRIQSLYPGLVHAVYYGLANNQADHEAMALTAWMPWLVTLYSKQGVLGALRRHAPAATDGPGLAILTRDGDALLISSPTDLNVVRAFIDELIELAWLTHPYNTRAWPDRAHYARATRPLRFARETAGPELIGNPLRPDGLRARGITGVQATIKVDADGKITGVALAAESGVPEKFKSGIADALRRSAVFAPAIDQGKPVAGTYPYRLEVPPADARRDADAAWLDRGIRGEIPLRDWLLLTSVPVNEKDFDDVESVAIDGTVKLRAMEVSEAKVSRAAQTSAFRTNFFDAAGASTVAPRLGATQEIEGRTLTWRAVRTTDGYVDMTAGQKQGATEYCIGYAYTEFDLSAPIQAWLGIGSDDGLLVWLNGELVNDRWQHRISHLDDDVVPLQLKAGTNRILLKVQNKTRNWSFVSRLRYRER